MPSSIVHSIRDFWTRPALRGDGCLNGRKPYGLQLAGIDSSAKAILLPMKTALQHYTSRTADKFVVRLPEGMRDRIAEVAKQHHRSMNSEIIARLEHSLLDLPTLPDFPSRQTLNDQRVDELNQPERELLLRFRDMSRRQQNALLALLVAEQA